MENPHFTAGKNIAVKVPVHKFEQTISFYRDILGFKVLEFDNPGNYEGKAFEFGSITLWIDKCPSLSQAEIWLEIETPDAEKAKDYFRLKGIHRRDEIEELPPEVRGFWIAGPSDIIHLVNEP